MIWQIMLLKYIFWVEFLLGRKYFTGDNGYQKLLDFAPTVSLIILDSNQKVTKR